MMHHAKIAQRAFNTPLMVDPAKALAFLSGLGPRITGQDITFAGMEVEATDQAAAALPACASLFGNDLAQRHQRNGSQPYAVVDGIAVIEIAGTLVHRGAWIGQSSGLTSYEGIAAQLQAALADPGIRGIALDIDSFGGEVAGPSIWPIASARRAHKSLSMPLSPSMRSRRAMSSPRRRTASPCPALAPSAASAWWHSTPT